MEYTEGKLVKTTDFVANFVYINGKTAWNTFDLKLIMAYLGKTYPNILHHNATASIHNLARILRKSETEAEKLLWQELKNRKCSGLKFRRQHPFSKFVLDFYCNEKKLVVEVDGAVHNNSDVKERDENRTYELEQAGLTVIPWLARVS